MPGDTIGGKYIVDRPIGEGAMGVVLRARHAITGKIVAIKMLKPQLARQREIAERFLREARATARIRHRNIVDTYDAGVEGGIPYLVMECLEGETLDAHLARRPPLSLEETWSILSPVFGAVHAAHRAGVIHRDLKPANIFLANESETNECVPKVLDFGVSKLMEDVSGTRLTNSGASVGTALYMPLEQMIGAHNANAASDVYALGVILYECLTSKHPYDAHSVAELALKVAGSSVVPLADRRADFSSELSAVVMRSITNDLAIRYADVPAFATALVPFGFVWPPRGTDVRSGEFVVSRALRPHALDTAPLGETLLVQTNERAPIDIAAETTTDRDPPWDPPVSDSSSRDRRALEEATTLDDPPRSARYRRGVAFVGILLIVAFVARPDPSPLPSAAMTSIGPPPRDVHPAAPLRPSEPTATSMSPPNAPPVAPSDPALARAEETPVSAAQGRHDPDRSRRHRGSRGAETGTNDSDPPPVPTPSVTPSPNDDPIRDYDPGDFFRRFPNPY